MASPPLTTDMILVFTVIGLTIFLFLVEWVRVDVVAILVMVTLPFLGLIGGRETFQGLSSTAVVSIIAVIIMGRGLDHTGVINRVVRPILRLAASSERRIIILLSATVAVTSSIVQNIGAAALFLPAIRRLSRRAAIPISRLLMPVGFAAILGGTITLVGSSPLIMLNDLIRPFNLEPFSLFSVTPAGIALVAVGIAYFVVLGRIVLPAKPMEGSSEATTQDPVEFYPEIGSLSELRYPHGAGPSYSVVDLCDAHNVHTVALSLDGGRSKLIPPDRDMTISPGSVFAVFGAENNVREMAEQSGFEIMPETKVFREDLTSDISGVVEAVVPPHSQFVGKTMGDLRLRHNWLVAPLALSREEHTYYTGLGTLTLHPGDTILMHGTWERFHAFRHKRNLLFVQSLDHEVLHPQKAKFALSCFALATALVIFTQLPLSVCLMDGAVGMVLTGVLTIDEAYRGVEWRTVFLLAGLIPLGLAMEKTQAANWLAFHFLALIGKPPPVVFFLMVGLLSTVFTLVVSNVGAVVLLVPLVVDLAQQSGIDPRMAAMVVGLATSNSFLLPTHQVNALYMGPGRYSSLDFIKAGAPLSLLYLLVLTAVVMLVY